MAVSQYRKHIYEFGPFRLDVQERLLLRADEAVPLIPKAFDLLVVLVESRGRLLEKEELLRRVWPDSFVEEGNLAQNISVIRKALGESDTAKFIETVPRRGYRFVASVKEVRDRGADLIIVERVKSPITIEQEVEGRVNAEAGRHGAPLHVARPMPVRVTAWSFKVLAALGLLAVTAAVAFYWNWGKPNPAVKTIAVLPFKPLSADSRDEALELGMADTLINKLSGIRQLAVRPLDVVRKYAALDQDPLAAGRELGVDYVLAGNLQMIGEKTRANVRLLSVKDGTTVWAETCDEQCSNVFELQDAIAERIASAVKIELTGEEEKQLVKHYTENTDAYKAYLRGRYFHHKRTPQMTEKSIEHLKEAIRLDPNYAPAYGTLADAYLSLAKLGGRFPVQEVLPRAKEAAEKALAIDEMLAEAHAAQGSIRFYEWDWPGAEREFKRAVEINADYQRNSSDYEHFLLAAKRFDEALAESKRVLELDPVSAHYNRNVAMILYFVRRYDEAIEQCQRALELDPNMFSVYGWLAAAYEQKKFYDESVAAILKEQQVSGASPEEVKSLREAYVASGWKGFWRKSLDFREEWTKRGKLSTVRLAEIYARLGEKDQAFALLEEAHEQRLTRLKFLNTDPVWEDLRSDPRYADLVRRMGLEP